MYIYFLFPGQHNLADILLVGVFVFDDYADLRQSARHRDRHCIHGIRNTGVYFRCYVEETTHLPELYQ